MKALRLMAVLVALVALVALGMSTPAVAADFFVIKSRSGLLKVVDHKPGGGATIVKGPFKTMEEALKAMNAMTGTKVPEPRCQGSAGKPTS